MPRNRRDPFMVAEQRKRSKERCRQRAASEQRRSARVGRTRLEHDPDIARYRAERNERDQKIAAAIDAARRELDAYYEREAQRRKGGRPKAKQDFRVGRALAKPGGLAPRAVPGE